MSLTDFHMFQIVYHPSEVVVLLMSFVYGLSMCLRRKTRAGTMLAVGSFLLLIAYLGWALFYDYLLATTGPKRPEWLRTPWTRLVFENMQPYLRATGLILIFLAIFNSREKQEK